MTHPNNPSLSNETLPEESLACLCKRGFDAVISREQIDQLERSFVQHGQTRRACIVLLSADMAQMLEFCKSASEEFDELMTHIDAYEKSLEYQQEIVQTIRARLLLSQYAIEEEGHD